MKLPLLRNEKAIPSYDFFVPGPVYAASDFSSQSSWKMEESPGPPIPLWIVIPAAYR